MFPVGVPLLLAIWENARMKKWEYASLQVTGNRVTLTHFQTPNSTQREIPPTLLMRCVADLGVEGWEMISASTKSTDSDFFGSMHGSQMIYFKRPLEIDLYTYH
jgi:hypothetical protein